MATESGIFYFANKDGTIGIVVKFGGKIGVGTPDKKTYIAFSELMEKKPIRSTDVGKRNESKPLIVLDFNDVESVESVIECLVEIKKNLEETKCPN